MTRWRPGSDWVGRRFGMRYEPRGPASMPLSIEPAKALPLSGQVVPTATDPGQSVRSGAWTLDDKQLLRGVGIWCPEPAVCRGGHAGVV
jgi:hypothetical protein